MQKHRATRLHYDFRLEADGVLASWAIPKGPSFDPHERRLAMRTEDHPFEYRTFEGIIPEGNYGAGEVIIWDEGTYRLVEGDDPAAEIAGGKIKFTLSGKKLHGEFTLVKIKPRSGESGDPWLLIKDKDEYVDPEYDAGDQPESVKSGRTIEDLQAAKGNVRTWKSDRPASQPPAAARKKAAAKSVKGEPIPREVKPMLATLVDEPFDDKDWIFELKWDGYRAIVTVETDGSVSAVSRNGLDLLGRFPELKEIAGAFRSRPVVIDGEVCVLDAQGRSSFQALQSRDLRAPRSRRDPVTYIAFDVLYADGRDLRKAALVERKEKLEAILVDGHGVMYSKHVARTGKKLFEQAAASGLEGIIGKLVTSPYRGTRTREWVKIKAKRRQEFVIGGWTEPRGSRDAFGALLLGVYDGDDLVYAGHVGTGFDHATLKAVYAKLAPVERKTSPFKAKPKTNTPAHFCSPNFVAECTFTEWTRDGILRHPVFLGLRLDKDPRDVVRERASDADERP